MRHFAALLFFGNYFYAICAVALAMESCLQLHIPLNSWIFYAMLFGGTVVYYTKAYITETYIPSANIRTQWYNAHMHTIKRRQYILAFAVAALALFYMVKYGCNLQYLNTSFWCLLFLFPLTALFYYNLSFFRLFRFNLRKTGWLKPFIISFVWAGGVTIYPIICSIIETKIPYTIGYTTAWFFFKNWMFITVLCIMFDIKDYTSDSNHQLKTMVVRLGPRPTLLFVIIPLIILVYTAFICFAWLNHFTFERIFINSIPFILLLIVAHSLHKQKSIMYYLIIIDGLMLVKAVCGIFSSMK